MYRDIAQWKNKVQTMVVTYRGTDRKPEQNQKHCSNAINETYKELGAVLSTAVVSSSICLLVAQETTVTCTKGLTL